MNASHRKASSLSGAHSWLGSAGMLNSSMFAVSAERLPGQQGPHGIGMNDEGRSKEGCCVRCAACVATHVGSTEAVRLHWQQSFMKNVLCFIGGEYPCMKPHTASAALASHAEGANRSCWHQALALPHVELKKLQRMNKEAHKIVRSFDNEAHRVFAGGVQTGGCGGPTQWLWIQSRGRLDCAEC